MGVGHQKDNCYAQGELPGSFLYSREALNCGRRAYFTLAVAGWIRSLYTSPLRAYVGHELFCLESHSHYTATKNKIPPWHYFYGVCSMRLFYAAGANGMAA